VNIQDSIIKTIKYFNLFDFPLTAEEIMQYLYNFNKPLHIKEVKGNLGELVNDGVLEEIKDFYVLSGRTILIEKRKSRQFIAEKLWNRVQLYSQYLRVVPFVRMVAVCNNLSYNNPSEESDIDLFIVIKSGRMWSSRLFISLLLQFFGVRRHGNLVRGRFCLSFFVTEKHLSMEPLQIKPEDPYLAYWTTLLTPVYGKDMYSDFMGANKNWLKKDYGLSFPEDRYEKHGSLANESKFKLFLEWILSGFIGDSFESLLKKTFKKRTLNKMKLANADASIIVKDDILKFHNHDRRHTYYHKWKND